MVLTHQQIAQKVNQMTASNQQLQPINQTKTNTVTATTNTATSKASSNPNATVISLNADTSKASSNPNATVISLNADTSKVSKQTSKPTSYTITGKQQGTVDTSVTGTTSLSYNTYSDKAIERAQELQKTGSPLQQIASNLYLGVNDPNVRGSAKDWENFVDSKNAYAKYSQGETANTGDDFKDFMMNVASTIIYSPASIQRTVASGLMAGADILTANAEAVTKSIQTGDLSIAGNTLKVTKNTLNQAKSDFADSFKESITNPETLTAMAITLPLGGVGSSGKVLTTATKTGTKITTKELNTATKTLSINTDGSIAITGKQINIPTGKSSIRITKGKDETGNKYLGIEKVNKENKVTGKIESYNIKGQTIQSTADGNIVITTQNTNKSIKIGDKKIGKSTQTTTNTITKETSNPIAGTGKIQQSTATTTTKSINTKSISSGNLILSAKSTITKSTATKGTQHIQAGTRARISTKGVNTTSKTVNIYNKGEITRSKTLTNKSDIDKITVDVNIGNTALQLPGKTVSKSAGNITLKNNGLIILGKKATNIRTVKTTRGNRTTSTSKARNSTNTYKSTKTEYTKKNERGTTESTKETKKTKKQSKKKSEDETEIKGIARVVNGKIVRIKPEKYVKGVERIAKEIKAGKISKTEKEFLANRRKNKLSPSGDAEALYNRRLSVGNTKTQIKDLKESGMEIKGLPSTDANGKITRVFPEGYVEGVKKVNQEINAGKISKAEREFLANRRKNKLAESGDAEALYNKRKNGGVPKTTTKKSAESGITIKGIATTNKDGKVVRVFPKGYTEAVKKVNQEIKSGKISQAEKDFLANRRKNKLSESGDAEALYNRRITGKPTNTATKTVNNSEVTIKGIATTGADGKVVRVIPAGYKQAVLKVNTEIKTGKITKAEKDFLDNRRKNKLSPSGDAEALYNRRITGGVSKESAKSSSTGGLSIKGLPSTDANGKVVRVFPDGYVEAVKKVNAEIKSGKLSQADKDFLANRRKNRLAESGDAEALYNRRITAGKNPLPKSTSKSATPQKSTTSNTNSHASGNMMYMTRSQGKGAKPKSSPQQQKTQSKPATPKPTPTPSQKKKQIRNTINRSIVISSHVGIKVTDNMKQTNPTVTIPQLTPSTSGNVVVSIPKPSTITKSGSTSTGGSTITHNSHTTVNFTKTSTSTGKNKTKTSTNTKTGSKPKSNTKVKVIVAPAVKKTSKQAQKQQVKQNLKKAQKVKPATLQRKKNKKVIRLSDDDYKKRRKTTKKSKKSAIRKETVNQFGWLGYDSKKAEKPKRITL